jgi:NAD(P)-dependent dehydrogenase (short-subunit alcohol dehydrogenase family)
MDSAETGREEKTMSERRVWFITGAGSGMGAAFARTALAAGNAVVATGRNSDAVAKAVGEADHLLVTNLDVTSTDDAGDAANAAVQRFGRIDVLVNNAGSSFKGYFEEMTPVQVEQQLAINLVGPMNVTRAVLPVMRRQRSGHVISISSGAGLVAFEYSSVYAASKFGLEGWMGALQQEVAPFGIHTTIVNPGWFHTDLIRLEPSMWPQVSIDDYAARSATQRQWWEAQNGKQSGDPAKLAQALLTIAGQGPPPRRFIAGADVIALAEQKIADLKAQIDAYRDLSTSLDIDER